MDEGFTATAASLAATKDANSPLGTPAWSAPEVLKQDGNTDLFRGRALQMLQDSAPALITVYNRCCVVDPKKRIAFNEITQILQSAVDQAEASGFPGLSLQSLWWDLCI